MTESTGADETVEVHTRAVDPSEHALIATIAARMRLTLVEVLGQARGEAMYSLDWLDDRVRFHLDPARSEGEVFVAEAGGDVVGHTIVRVEREDAGAAFGLFSTTWVAPSRRRGGVASALLDRGEAWMSERGLPRAVTHTAEGNHGLIRLYEGRGYAIVLRREAMVRLERALRA